MTQHIDDAVAQLRDMQLTTPELRAIIVRNSKRHTEAATTIILAAKVVLLEREQAVTPQRVTQEQPQ